MLLHTITEYLHELITGRERWCTIDALSWTSRTAILCLVHYITSHIRALMEDFGIVRCTRGSKLSLRVPESGNVFCFILSEETCGIAHNGMHSIYGILGKRRALDTNKTNPLALAVKPQT